MLSDFPQIDITSVTFIIIFIIIIIIIIILVLFLFFSFSYSLGSQIFGSLIRQKNTRQIYHYKWNRKWKRACALLCAP